MDDTSTESVLASSRSVLRTPALGAAPLPIHLAVEHTRTRAEQDAVRTATGSLTWRQVGSRAHQLAEALQQHGVARGDHVIVSVPSSELVPVALLGVLLVGAVYAPVDATYPDERVQVLARELDAACAVADRELPQIDAPVVTMTPGALDGVAWDDSRTCAPLADVSASDTAYVIFTSGSTGTPHGVAISHGQIAASTHARTQFYLPAPTSFAMVSSISFDSSLVGLFWSLAGGFPLVLADHLTIRDADALLARLNHDCPSHLLCVPTLYAQLLERRTAAQQWPDHVIVAGEPCRPALVARHFAAVPTSALTNEYGPTEGTIWATAYHCRPTDTEVPIGTPVPGMWTAVVDGADQPVAEGTSGELLIGGPQIASGYTNGERSERFGSMTAGSPLPGDVGDRFFRTGDRVVQRDGQIHFLGRNDDQLSIAGSRIEPAEIENALTALPGVTAAVVLAQDPRTTDEIMLEIGPDAVAEAMRRSAESTNTPASLRAALAQHPTSRRRLVAHVEGNVAVDQLRPAIEAVMPGSHRPSVYVVHDVLPRRTAGKIDREQLYAATAQSSNASRPTSSPTAPASTAPASASAGKVQDICALFANALNRDQVGPDESFFDLGGDSLGAFSVMTTFEERFGVRVETGIIHRAPTPRLFAKEVNFDDTDGIDDVREPNGTDGTDEIVMIDVQPNGETAPIFMLHHVGVNGRFARVLSRHLGDSTPVFAAFDETAVLSPFLPPSPRVKEPNIAEICLKYANAIEQRWPSGPIVLLGHCQGGVIVHEVAHLLVQRGRTIPSMIVVNDWHAPEVETFVGPLREMVYEFKREPALPLLKARARSAQRRLVSMINPNSPESKHHRMVVATNHAYHTHTYTKYDGRVLVVRRKDDPRWPDGTTGWGDVLSDLTIEYLEGEPFKPTGAPGLATMVQAELSR